MICDPAKVFCFFSALICVYNVSGALDLTGALKLILCLGLPCVKYSLRSHQREKDGSAEMLSTCSSLHQYHSMGRGRLLRSPFYGALSAPVLQVCVLTKSMASNPVLLVLFFFCFLLFFFTGMCGWWQHEQHEGYGSHLCTQGRKLIRQTGNASGESSVGTEISANGA